MTPASAAVKFTLNGKRVTVRAHPLRRLLDVLREDFGLTGTKEGCGEGECGACTVVIDGQAVNSCLVPIAQVRGVNVLTIEGLRGRHPLQKAFAGHGGAQCGICTPGMVMAAVALGPNPTLEDVRVGLAGNLCRCTGYIGIYRSIKAASADGRKARGESRKAKVGKSTVLAGQRGPGSARLSASAPSAAARPGRSSKSGVAQPGLTAKPRKRGAR